MVILFFLKSLLDVTHMILKFVPQIGRNSAGPFFLKGIQLDLFFFERKGIQLDLDWHAMNQSSMAPRLPRFLHHEPMMQSDCRTQVSFSCLLRPRYVYLVQINNFSLLTSLHTRSSDGWLKPKSISCTPSNIPLN